MGIDSCAFVPSLATLIIMQRCTCRWRRGAPEGCGLRRQAAGCAPHRPPRREPWLAEVRGARRCTRLAGEGAPVPSVRAWREDQRAIGLRHSPTRARSVSPVIPSAPVAHESRKESLCRMKGALLAVRWSAKPEISNFSRHADADPTQTRYVLDPSPLHTPLRPPIV